MAGSEEVSDLAARRRTDAAKEVTIRPLTAQAEFQDAVDLQRQIWGFNDIELLPVRLL